MEKRLDLAALFLPLLGIGFMLLIWTVISTTWRPICRRR